MYEQTNKQLVLDADDLIQYPEQMVRRYCEAIGVLLKESVLDSNSTVKRDADMV